jgi:hypothetical protein
MQHKPPQCTLQTQEPVNQIINQIVLVNKNCKTLDLGNQGDLEKAHGFQTQIVNQFH